MLCALKMRRSFLIMNKTEAIEQLQTFKHRLQTDVINAYGSRGGDYGKERFAAWRRQISKFLDENLPDMNRDLDTKLTHMVYHRSHGETDLDLFMRVDGNTCLAFIDSLTLDIQNDEFDFSPKQIPDTMNMKQKERNVNKIFIVHGHNELLLTKVARFIELLGYEPVILHEQANKGMTIIEKIEANSDVGFAIVLYTVDDKGNTVANADKGILNDRARQNVIFEHGYLIAKLTRSHVVPLMGGRVEIPSDISGVVYVENANWQLEIGKEMAAAGYKVDFNKVIGT